MNESISPMTGEEMLNKSLNKGSYDEYNDLGIGYYGVTDQLRQKGFEYGKQLQCGGFNPPMAGDIFLDELQTKRLLALARSKVYWAQQNSRPHLLFLLRREYEAAREEFDQLANNFELVFVDELHREAEALTWHEKTIRTLVNMVKVLDGTGGGLTVFSRPTPSAPDTPDRKGRRTAIYYGCSGEDAMITHRIMVELGYIANSGYSLNPITILAKGYEAYDEYRLGQPKVTRDCFLVCKFTPQMDRIYEEVYEPIGATVEKPVTVYRVKDEEHFDKIDDRIIEDIRRSLVVIVDLTEHNFNIGFEAGYALALGKVIVWTSPTLTEKEVSFPFDIAMQNVLQYDPNNLEDFKKRLSARLQAAVRIAGG